MFTQKFCRDNASEGMFKGNATIIGVMLYDSFAQIFLVRDFTSSAAKTAFLHHFLAIFGSAIGLAIGRYTTSVAFVTSFTELTTLFVNLRWIMHFLGLTESPIYLLNGVCMAVGFLFARMGYQSYLFFAIVLPAIEETDWSRDAPLVSFWAKQSKYPYGLLLCLNTYWFYLMIAGIIKHMGKKKNKVD